MTEKDRERMQHNRELLAGIREALSPPADLSESEEIQLMHRLEELARIEGLRETPTVVKIPSFTQQEIDNKTEYADIAMVFISSRVASNSASLNFTSGINSSYEEYRFLLVDIVPASDGANLFFRTSSDGGSTWDSGASDYGWQISIVGVGIEDQSDSEIELALDVGSDTGESLSGELRLYNPAGTSLNKLVKHEIVYITSGAGLAQLIGAGVRLAVADIDAVQFLFSAGNIESGTIRMYGVVKS